jgi:protease I
MAIDGKSVAFLVAKEGIEQVELTEPWKAVEHAGGTPRLISVEPGEVQGFNHLTPADRFAVDETADRARAGDYSALALPGGRGTRGVHRRAVPADQQPQAGRPAGVLQGTDPATGEGVTRDRVAIRR